MACTGTCSSATHPAPCCGRSSFAAPTSAPSANQHTVTPVPGGNRSSKRPAGLSPSPSPTPRQAQLMMPGSNGSTPHTAAGRRSRCVWARRHHRPHQHPQCLEARGLRAVVESHDTIRLDGRRPRTLPDPHSASSRRRTRTTRKLLLLARGLSLRRRSRSRSRPRLCSWSTSTDAASGLTASRRSGRRSGGRTPPRSTSPSPSRGCSPSTAPPSTGWCGPG